MRWLAWGILLALLPLLLTYVFKLYRDQTAPSLGDLLGSGHALLVAISWSAAALRELREAPVRRGVQREIVTFFGTCFLVLCAAAYGFVTSDTLAGRVQTDAQAREVAIGSVLALVLAGATSTYSVAVGTPSTREVAA